MPTVTCSTDGCTSSGKPRFVSAALLADVGSVVCGNCEQPITDIVEEE
jgi:hypothetical protein